MPIFSKMLFLLGFEFSLRRGVRECGGVNKNPGREGEKRGKGSAAPGCREPLGEMRGCALLTPALSISWTASDWEASQGLRTNGEAVEVNARATWKSREWTFLLLLLVTASWEILKVSIGRVSA